MLCFIVVFMLQDTVYIKTQIKNLIFMLTIYKVKIEENTKFQQVLIVYLCFFTSKDKMDDCKLGGRDSVRISLPFHSATVYSYIFNNLVLCMVYHYS